MRNLLYWVSWSLALLFVNLGAFPIAMFSLFGTPEGTSIFSMDHLIAFSIVLLANIVIIQLFVAIKKQNLTAFIIGLVLAIIEISAFALLIFTKISFINCLSLTLISVIGAAALLVFKKPIQTKPIAPLLQQEIQYKKALILLGSTPQ